MRVPQIVFYVPHHDAVSEVKFFKVEIVVLPYVNGESPKGKKGNACCSERE